ncbi:DNA-binding transcriptional LysR family regulator [Kibdelosporangium banguiense]|uniref:DNA-binding transcriptional LysR family regulator n=1 Tax=Kibdelosporangium banguiense TaxID=1365924 RepID=A0ABS4U0E4_9PSEU|nr:LysR substrate-binding domain-containing protein [Kibdelosporangium banguiense]MBP2330124.1 DNA-binding transcriptional LysR family regulator [Kibdelosporangium banguiense]
MDLRELRYFVAVAEELHFGRAATRLHMTQPPLSRAIKQLETDLGCVLLQRSPSGVALTPAGASLYDEALTLLAQADQARTRVAAAAGTATITIGTLANSAEEVGTSLAAAFRKHHPSVHVHIREADLTDPTIGLRAGLVDVALTRTPFDTTGITTQVLRTDPVGVVLRADDPLAGRESLRLQDLDDRPWFRFPEGTDPIWQAYWSGGQPRDGLIVRTVHECIQAVLWNGTVGLTTLGHPLPEGLTAVALADMAPSSLVVAWTGTNPGPLIHSFARVAAATYSSRS